MIRYTSSKQLSLDGFILPFGGELNPENRWVKKPRTYRRKARKQYLAIAKNKKPSLKVRRRGLREQLQHMRRNLGHISSLLDSISCRPFPLPYNLQRQSWIIQHVYLQQAGMYQTGRTAAMTGSFPYHNPMFNR